MLSRPEEAFPIVGGGFVLVKGRLQTAEFDGEETNSFRGTNLSLETGGKCLLVDMNLLWVAEYCFVKYCR